MNHIVELRKKYGYSQTQLANLLGVHQTAVSQWELGKTLPDILTTQKLAVIFGITVEDLLSDAGYTSLQPISMIRNNCQKLNEAGLEKVLAYTEDLLLTGKYERKPDFSSVEVVSVEVKDGNG